MRSLNRHPDDRFQSARELGEALQRLRLRYAPECDDKVLGDFLSRVFKAEKDAEDAVLRELEGAIPEVPTDKTKGVLVVPPNALAFEHTAVLAPDNDVLLAASTLDDQEATARGPRRDDDATPTLREGLAKPPKPLVVKPEARVARPLEPEPLLKLKGKINPTRMSFGVQFDASGPQDEPSLVEEIEASATDEDEERSRTDKDDGRARRRARRQLRFALIAGSVFIGATGLGFLAIWLWLLNQS